MQIDLCIDSVLWTETNVLFSAYLKTVENRSVVKIFEKVSLTSNLRILHNKGLKLLEICMIDQVQ